METRWKRVPAHESAVCRNGSLMFGCSSSPATVSAVLRLTQRFGRSSGPPLCPDCRNCQKLPNCGEQVQRTRRMLAAGLRRPGKAVSPPLTADRSKLVSLVSRALLDRSRLAANSCSRSASNALPAGCGRRAQHELHSRRCRRCSLQTRVGRTASGAGGRLRQVQSLQCRLADTAMQTLQTLHCRLQTLHCRLQTL